MVRGIVLWKFGVRLILESLLDRKRFSARVAMCFPNLAIFVPHVAIWEAPNEISYVFVFFNNLFQEFVFNFP